MIAAHARSLGYVLVTNNTKDFTEIDGLVLDNYFRKKVEEYTGLMNRWFLVPHWGYDFEKLCFIEISDSREYSSDFDKSEEIKPDRIIRVVD